MPNVAVPAGWPYDASMDSAHYTQGSTGITSQIRCMPCNENWAHACFQNMSVGTRLVCYWRVGFELQCHPDSTWSPYLRLSPPYDRSAIEAYFKIARELKDAYPVEYNDKGKLWDIIKKAIRTALPVVGAMGPFGAMAAGLGSFLIGPEKAARKAKAAVPTPSVSQVETRDKPPAAAIEAIQKQEAASDALRSVMARRSVARKAVPTRKRQRAPPKGGAYMQPIALPDTARDGRRVKTMVMMLKPKRAAAGQ